jgi:hypothetical protein
MVELHKKLTRMLQQLEAEGVVPRAEQQRLTCSIKLAAMFSGADDGPLAL